MLAIKVTTNKKFTLLIKSRILNNALRIRKGHIFSGVHLAYGTTWWDAYHDVNDWFRRQSWDRRAAYVLDIYGNVPERLFEKKAFFLKQCWPTRVVVRYLDGLS